MGHKTKPTLEQRRRRGTVQRSGEHLWLWGAGAATLVLLRMLVWLSSTRIRPDEIAGILTYTNLAHGHQPGPLQYPNTPPAGSIHNPVWQNCGVYDQPVIRHHQDGVLMAQDASAQIKRSEVAQLASSIVAAQQSESEYMQSLLAQRGAVPPDPLPGYSPQES